MNNKNKTLKEIFILAFQNYKKKNIETAELYCNKILNIDPRHFDSIFLLANLSAAKGNFNEAKKLLENAKEIRHNNVSVYNNLGNIHKQLKNFQDAIKSYQRTIEINPYHINAHYNLGVVYYDLKEFNKSIIYFQKTIKIRPDYAAAHFNLGNAYVQIKDSDKAIDYYNNAIQLKSNYVSAHNNLGLVYRGLNNFEKAVNSYKNAIKINPKHAGAYHNLALAFKELGEFKNAINAHKTAIKQEPENLVHCYYLSELDKTILNLDLKNKIKNIIKKDNCTKRNLAYGNFLLSRYEQKDKNYKKELNYLSIGHKSFFDSEKKKFELGLKFCFDDVLQIVESTHLKRSNKKTACKLKPIFIVGVPRCGSTLVEKIIASGRKFLPMGEETGVLGDFVTKKILQKQAVNLGDAENLRRELIDIYKKKGLIEKKSDFTFTDKSLDNYFYIKLIKDIFPNAKIINCKRDPLSSIISIFQNNLTELAWAHNLDNIFKYFDNYFRVINKFKKLYPDFIYDLQLEKLIDDPEMESKKLTKFCNLTWNKKCLEFYKRKDLISKTASNIQIRKAIYKNKINKYLPYKQFLPVLKNKYSWFN